MRRKLKLLVFGVPLFVTGLARAEPDEGAKLVARELMAKGRTQRAALDFSGALESFSKAHAIMHVPTTLVEAARARADTGQLLEALELLHELPPPTPAVDEPAPFSRARADATALRADLEARVPTLRLDWAGSPDRQGTPKVSVDGAPRPDCVASCRVNPGKHVIAARTERALAEEQVQLRERESTSLELVFSPLSIPGRLASAPVAAPTAARTTHTRVPTTTWVAGGTAIAALSAGAWLGVSAVNQRNDLRRSCAPECTAADVNGVRRRAVWANVAFGVGLAASALAVTSYLMGRHEPDEAEPSSKKELRLDVAAAPTVSTPGGYVSLEGTF
jgi:hypothetical protein